MGHAEHDDEGRKNSGETIHDGAPCMVANSAYGAHKQALVGSGMRQAEALFRQSRRLTVDRDIAAREHNRLTGRVKVTVCLPGCPYSVGRIAIEIELSLVPLTCSTNGLAESSYFMVLRMPSQSVAPLNAFGLRKWPSCTTSTQPPEDRLTV